MDDITILIRTWNRPEMLDNALQSVAEQDCRVVVAVDPRAKQGIYDMLEQHSVEVARCKRQGLGAAWNEGMAHIDTGYVYVLDDGRCATAGCRINHAQVYRISTGGTHIADIVPSHDTGLGHKTPPDSAKDRPHATLTGGHWTRDTAYCCRTAAPAETIFTTPTHLVWLAPSQRTCPSTRTILWLCEVAAGCCTVMIRC